MWAQTPQQFTAVGQADVTNTIAAFKAAIGGADNGTTLGTPATGFRQVTWDDIPDTLAAPNELPGDYYLTSSTRGMRITGRGYVSVLQVSASPGNPTGTLPLFGNLNPAFPSYFTTYSAPRLFIGSSEGGPSFDLRFAVPGSPGTTATVSAFGAVFTDVGLATSTTVELFDIDGRSYGRFAVPAASGHQTLSFFGIIIPGAHIAEVLIREGTSVASYSMPEDEQHDVVAMDDVLYSEPQPAPPPAISLTTPTASTTYNATGPFLTVAGRASNVTRVDWTSSRGSSGTAIGQSDWSVQNIPLAAGVNDLTFTVTGHDGRMATTVLHVNSGSFAYFLAEGSTGYFFDTDILIANPNPVPASIKVTFSAENGVDAGWVETLAPTSRRTINVDSVAGLGATALATRVVSVDRLPLVVERTMFWDQSRYGGKGAAAVDTPSETWVFAEGVQNGFFNTFVLLQNPDETQPSTATLTFARDLGEPPVIQQVTLPPASRVTVDAGAIPDLVGRSFGLSVQASAPIIAERATYFGTTPTQLWSGGHGSPGVTTPSQTWYFAEGATGAFRDTFLLLSNPTDQTAYPNAFFYGGKHGYQAFDLGALPPHGRKTVPIDTLTYGPLNPDEPSEYPLADGDFTIFVQSYWPIVAERAMYWVGPPGPWADGTTTFGTTTPGLRWGFAEGRVGGPLTYHTYVRVFNPAYQIAADVQLTFLKSDGTIVARTYSVPGVANSVPPPSLNFITIDVNAIPELAGESFGIIVESTNGVPIVTERSMYWDANGVFWAAGLTTAGTRLP